MNIRSSHSGDPAMHHQNYDTAPAFDAAPDTGLGSGDFCVRIIDLPHSVKGFVTYDEDGFPNIYLNARISRYEQQRAMRHELAHISRQDAFSDEEIRNIEK